MTKHNRRAILLAVLAALAAGCTASGATHRGAVAYNRAFNQARNEILLLNILRARDGYPQQYSTISQVVGSMRSDVSLVPVLSNIIGQTPFSLGSTGDLSTRDPTVTITPLETKEFLAGMMKPVPPEYVNDLLAQKWSPEIVEYLTVEGIGMIPTTDPDREPDKLLGVVAVSPADVAKLIGEQVPRGTRARIVGANSDKVLIQLTSSEICIQALPTKSDCGLKRQEAVLRSPAAMVRFLGKSLRDDPANPLFQVRSSRNPPADAIISTKFDGLTYYIDGDDRNSLETLALLAGIIGFQTTDAVLDSSRPTLTIRP